MLKCFFIKRKLYDYSCGELPAAGEEKVRRHLDACPACKRHSEEIKSLINLAEARKSPEVNDEFWHDFKTGLDRRLNSRLVPGFKLRAALSYKLRPALVYASVLIIIGGVWAYRLSTNMKMAELAQSEEAIINETNITDELGQAPNLDSDVGGYIDELNLLSQLGESLA